MLSNLYKNLIQFNVLMYISIIAVSTSCTTTVVNETRLERKATKDQIVKNGCDGDNLTEECDELKAKVNALKVVEEAQNLAFNDYAAETLNGPKLEEDPEECQGDPQDHCIVFAINHRIFSLNNNPDISTFVRLYDNENNIIGESGPNIRGSQKKILRSLYLSTKLRFFEGPYLGRGQIEIIKRNNRNNEVYKSYKAIVTFTNPN